MRKTILLKTTLFSLGMFSVFHAQAANTTFQATSKIENSCTMKMPDIHFGEIDANAPAIVSFGANHVQRDNLVIHCNKSTVYIISGEAPLSKTNGNTNPIGHFLVGENTGDELVYIIRYNKKWFADGKTYASGATYTISGIATGEDQAIPLEFYIYPYNVWPTVMPQADNYSKQHTFTISY